MEIESCVELQKLIDETNRKLLEIRTHHLVSLLLADYKLKIGKQKHYKPPITASLVNSAVIGGL